MFVNSQKSTKMSLNNRWHFWIIVVFPSLDLPSEPPGWVGKDFPQVRMQEVTTNVVSQQLTVNAQLGSPCLDEGWCFVGDGGPLQKRIRHKKRQTVSKHHFAGSQGFLCSCLVLKNVGVNLDNLEPKGPQAST